jgi:hypothetical protein
LEAVHDHLAHQPIVVPDGALVEDRAAFHCSIP